MDNENLMAKFGMADLLTHLLKREDVTLEAGIDGTAFIGAYKSDFKMGRDYGSTKIGKIW